MTLSFLHVLVPVLGLFVNMIVQLLGVRCVQSVNYYKSVSYGFFVGLFVVLALELIFMLFETKEIFNLIALSFANLVTYLFIAFSYFAFINLGVSSLRVRLLEELGQSKGGLSMSELLNKYGSREIVKNRIEKLEKAGQLQLIGDRYYLGESLALLMVKILEFLKFIVLGRKPRVALFK